MLNCIGSLEMIIQQYYAECDNCRFRSGDYRSLEVLVSVCTAVGWIIYVKGKSIICPHCINLARKPEDRKYVPSEDLINGNNN